MTTILLAFLIGVVAGLRSMTAPAGVAWGARTGALGLGGSWLSFLGSTWAVSLLTVLALGELVADKLPIIPSRKDIGPFVGRIVSGALCGAAVGVASGLLWAGGTAGVLGAVVGTLGGHAARARMAAAFGRDLPAALVEDVVAVAIVAAVWIAL